MVRQSDQALLDVSFSPDTLKETRQKLGLTMMEMAELVGVTCGLYEAWESGRRMPQSDLAKVSGIDVVEAREAARRRKNVFGSFGLKALRQRLGKKPQEMAEELGMSASQWQSLEVGRRTLSPSAFEDIVGKYSDLIEDLRRLA
ncbi:MAG: helix-turn-helix transcriptional regulator [Devosia sp.]